MRIAYKNKWTSWNNKYFKIYLIISNNKEIIEKKLKIVNRFIKKPAFIINKLPKIDNNVLIDDKDTIIEFEGLHKIDKCNCFKDYYNESDFENYRLSQLNTLILSSMNYLDSNDDLFLIFSYNRYLKNSIKYEKNTTCYEIGYISNFDKNKLKNNIENYNKSLVNEDDYPLIEYKSIYFHCGIYRLIDNNCFRKSKTIKLVDNTDYDCLKNLKHDETYIKTSLLVKYDHLTKEFNYDINKVKEFINNHIEK